MKPFAPVTKTCIFALPRWSRRPSIELDHAARHRAGHQQAKALVYLVEFVGAADQIVEIELLVHVEIGEDREIDVGTHRTVVGAADCLFPEHHVERADRRPHRNAGRARGAGRIPAAELYSFRHDLYRELLYERLLPTRRSLIHARVGRWLEGAWVGRLDTISSELAEHFERGNELARAIPHHQRAAA